MRVPRHGRGELGRLGQPTSHAAASGNQCLLQDGEIANEQRGWHRRIMLSDLLAYQEKMRREWRESLDQMAREGQAAGLYEATVGQAPRTR